MGNIRRHSPVAPLSIVLGACLAFGFLVSAPLSARAAEPAPGDDDFLGTAEEYAIIASTTVTEAGSVTGSEIVGDVALDPGSAVVLDDSTVVEGEIDISNGDSLVAREDLQAAYVALSAVAGIDEVPDGVDLAAHVGPYLPGVYYSGTGLQLGTGGEMELIGTADDVFIFRAGSTLVTGTGSVVRLLGAVQACNVYWQVGSSATLGVNSTFVGTILAVSSITATTGAQIEGRLLAGAEDPGGAVTLDDNRIDSRTACVRASSTDGTGGTGGTGGAGGTGGTGGTGGSGDAGGTGGVGDTGDTGGTSGGSLAALGGTGAGAASTADAAASDLGVTALSETGGALPAPLLVAAPILVLAGLLALIVARRAATGRRNQR